MATWAVSIDRKKVTINGKFNLMSERPFILALSGKVGSGKTTVANFLHSVNPERYPFEIFRFAGILKELVAAKTGTSVDDNYFRKDIVVDGKTLAQHQVDVGEGMRSPLLLGKDIFAKFIAMRIENSDAKFIVVDDLRLRVELDVLQEMGAFFVRINRPKVFRAPFMHNRDPTSITEVDLDDYDGFDLVVENDGEEEALCQRVLEFAMAKLMISSHVMDTVNFESIVHRLAETEITESGSFTWGDATFEPLHPSDDDPITVMDFASLYPSIVNDLEAFGSDDKEELIED